ncbi:hypothetical protein BGZ80_007899, partial [Entomortierella chlamydospora]
MVIDHQGSREDMPGEGQGYTDHSILDECALVPYHLSHVDHQASPNSKGHDVTSTGQQSTHSGEPNVVTD